jgi:hypothetical protein
MSSIAANARTTATSVMMASLIVLAPRSAWLKRTGWCSRIETKTSGKTLQTESRAEYAAAVAD